MALRHGRRHWIGPNRHRPGAWSRANEFQCWRLPLGHEEAAAILQQSLLPVQSNCQVLSTKPISCAPLHAFVRRWPWSRVSRSAEQLGRRGEYQSSRHRRGQECHCWLKNMHVQEKKWPVRASRRTKSSRKSRRSWERTRRCERRPKVPGGRSHIAQ